jgi:glycosyltransferase involved in cell wall biosynthesis
LVAYAACSKPQELEEARELFPAQALDLRLHLFPKRAGPRAKLQTLLRPFSFMFADAMKRELAATLAQGFDILHLEQLWSGWLGLGNARRSLINVHYLMSTDLADVRGGRFAERNARVLGSSAERRLIRSFRYFRACTPPLAESLRGMNPAADVETIPFGIDASLYAYIPDNGRPTAPVVTLIGSMNWQPGYSAAVRLLTRLWPEIKLRVPSARLRIVGWKAQSALANYLDTADVSIVADVPETRPFFEEASVFLYAPARGSGMKTKIQEAMAYGVPVVTTSAGVEGLAALDGLHAGVADDDKGLIDRTVQLLQDSGLGNRHRLAARRLIETQCGPAAVLSALEAVYARMRGGPLAAP